MNLVVAGCSISDRGGATVCYGDILSKMLNIPYIHHGSGCGSNYRIWRTVTNMVMQKKLTSNDCLVIQYTGTNRREFWTSNYPKEFLSTDKQVQLAEKYNDYGYLVKFKNSAHLWQRNKDTSNFFKQYEEQFCDDDYDNEMFAINHYNFSNMLKANNIKTIFVRLLGFGNDDVEKYSCGFPVIRVTNKDCDPQHLQDDGYHFNDNGHRWIAEIIKEHI